jgi:hypothetical protein
MMSSSAWGILSLEDSRFESSSLGFVQIFRHQLAIALIKIFEKIKSFLGNNYEINKIKSFQGLPTEDYKITSLGFNFRDQSSCELLERVTRLGDTRIIDAPILTVHTNSTGRDCEDKH